MINPKNGLESVISHFMNFSMPYLCYMTYTFHVEKCRDNGKYKLTKYR